MVGESALHIVALLSMNGPSGPFRSEFLIHNFFFGEFSFHFVLGLRVGTLGSDFGVLCVGCDFVGGGARG